VSPTRQPAALHSGCTATTDHSGNLAQARNYCSSQSGPDVGNGALASGSLCAHCLAQAFEPLSAPVMRGRATVRAALRTGSALDRARRASAAVRS